MKDKRNEIEFAGPIEDAQQLVLFFFFGQTRLGGPIQIEIRGHPGASEFSLNKGWFLLAIESVIGLRDGAIEREDQEETDSKSKPTGEVPFSLSIVVHLSDCPRPTEAPLKKTLETVWNATG